jgi:hypothetical protein
VLHCSPTLLVYQQCRSAAACSCNSLAASFCSLGYQKMYVAWGVQAHCQPACIPSSKPSDLHQCTHMLGLTCNSNARGVAPPL